MSSHADLTYPPMTADTGADAWQQIGECVRDSAGRESYGVRGIDGGEYVLSGTAGLRWLIVRRGYYGPGGVVESATPKGAVQSLNIFHVGETCVHCQHVNSQRGHGCAVCGRIRYRY